MIPCMHGYKDYTLKAKVNSFTAIEDELSRLKALFVGTDKQTDYYFQVAKGKLKLRQGTIENLITHYERIPENGIEKTIVYRYEKNPSLEEIESLKESRNIIGKVEKQRKIYWLENVKIHLDKMNDGQQFIEVEAIDVSNRFTENDLRVQCFEIQSKLGINDEDVIRTGYLPLP